MKFGLSNRNAIVALGSLLVAIVAVQAGASIAKQLFPLVSAAGATALRLGFSAVILGLLFRPWRYKPTSSQFKALILYGGSLGVMNFLFYQAIQRIPLGIGVALEFVGPLGLALTVSKQIRDWFWAFCAAAGIALILPLQADAASLDWLGILLALAAGVAWACYIVFGRKVASLPGGVTVSYGMMIAFLVTLPVSISSLTGEKFWLPSTLYLGLGVAIFSSALPFRLEMVALRRLPVQTFSIMMSLEPAFAALSGFLFLRENLTLWQLLGVLLVMIASAGTSLSSREVVAHEP